ncbi:MAG: hypothetical protein ABIO82_00965 [Ginsengibacter sp.]
MKVHRLTVLLITLVFFIFSCKKERFITSAQATLATSADTLTYDTIFTSVGSITQSFKIYNKNNQKLLINKIKLSGGATSFYNINVDGVVATEVNNIELEANDSMYVFVQVRIDPSTANLPFVVRDSILIEYNTNQKFVQLQAYGQNAIFLNKVRITGNMTWESALPYVITGGILIDSTATLTVRPGTRIFLHPDAPFLVDGTLIVAGTKDDKVVFAGDRLDEGYVDYPASWPGIYFSGSSKNNRFTFALIKNAYQGIVVSDPSTNVLPKVTLTQTIIDNIYDAGILGINSNIEASNCLITNCGKNILLVYGGEYSFVNCTVASYSNFFIDHKNPVLQVANFIDQDNSIFVSDLNANFKNCIFWGSGGTVEDEINVLKKPGGNFSVTFENTLYKQTNTDPADAQFSGNVLKNTDPLFDSINISKNYYDFHFVKDPSAPAIDQGSAVPLAYDLDGNPRIGIPDLGCYER